MLCHHCHKEIEQGFQFCPKCGLRQKTISQFVRELKGRRAVYCWVLAVLTLCAGGLTVFAVRQNQLSKLRQGKRDGLGYVVWLAAELPSASTLQLAIGKPMRSIEVSSGRSITWFRIKDGFLGMESAGGIFHYRPDKPLPQTVLSNYQCQGDPVSIAGESLTAYDGPNDLSLTALANEKQSSAVTEFIVWKRSAN